jgi:hypothetical protein
MPNKKVGSDEKIVNTIVKADAWKKVGLLAALQGDKKREVLEKAIELYYNTYKDELLG